MLRCTGYVLGLTHVPRDSRIGMMLRSLQRWSAPVILAVMLGGHVTELFDHWDRTLETGRDVDYTVVWVAACVGVVLVVTRNVIAVFRCQAKCKSSLIGPSSSILKDIVPEASAFGPSPPLALLPLRI